MSNEFLNGLQAASNAVAGNVAGPVDILAFLLRKAGMPVPENPIGGSNWMTQKGLMAPVRQGASQVIGETAGLLGPAMVSQFGPQISRGLLSAGDNMAAPRTLNPQTGAVVWHGSPHKFDKFDSSKIGTGEGAQAYGHGLYLADKRDVAITYAHSGIDRNRQATFNEMTAILPDGRRVSGLDLFREYYASGQKRNYKVSLGIKEQDGKIVAQMMDNKGRITEYPFDMRRFDPLAMKASAPKGWKFVDDDVSIYKVDLPDEKIARMLDWDKPLSQQAPEVRKAVLATKKQLTPDDIENLGGAAGVRALYDPANKIDNFLGTWQSLRGRPDAGESLLKAQGIPGIRYLDGGSRGAGQGTRNYVVFPGEEDALTILERNSGLLGP